jgi:hypothetical protein
MLRRRHVRRLLAESGCHWHSASAAAGTRTASRVMSPALRLFVSPSPSSLSLPAIAQSPLHAATYALCRLKRTRRHNVKRHNSTDDRIPHATSLCDVTDCFCRPKCTRRQHAKRRHASDDEKGPVEGISGTSRHWSPVCDASSGRPSSIKASPSLSPPSSPSSNVEPRKALSLPTLTTSVAKNARGDTLARDAIQPLTPPSRYPSSNVVLPPGGARG